MVKRILIEIIGLLILVIFWMKCIKRKEMRMAIIKFEDGLESFEIDLQRDLDDKLFVKVVFKEEDKTDVFSGELSRQKDIA
jgi:hypothetical protein